MNRFGSYNVTKPVYCGKYFKVNPYLEPDFRFLLQMFPSPLYIHLAQRLESETIDDVRAMIDLARVEEVKNMLLIDLHSW